MTEARLRGWNHEAGNKNVVFLHIEGEDALKKTYRLCLEVEFRPPFMPWTVRHRDDFMVRVRQGGL